MEKTHIRYCDNYHCENTFPVEKGKYFCSSKCRNIGNIRIILGIVFGLPAFILFFIFIPLLLNIISWPLSLFKKILPYKIIKFLDDLYHSTQLHDDFVSQINYKWACDEYELRNLS